jgi:hypothetical protein
MAAYGLKLAGAAIAILLIGVVAIAGGVKS